MLLVALLVPLESLEQVKVHQDGFIMLIYSGKFIKYWKSISPKIHLNQKKESIGNLDTLLVFFEGPWWVGFNESDFEKNGLEVGEILNFDSFCCWKFQLNYK